MFTRAKAESAAHAKRFWKEAGVGARGDAGWPVTLDGRTPQSPGGRRLVLPSEALAALVAAEWAAQGEFILTATMPATRLAFTAIDRIADAREAVADEVAAYAGSDALCYFAEGPDGLIRREEEAWGPWLDWAESDLGLAFVRVRGLIHRPQPAQTVARVRALALEFDDFGLAGLAWAASLFGSAVLALALARGRLDGEAALQLSRLDEIFQEERWGVDEEAAARVEGLRAEARALEAWFRAL